MKVTAAVITYNEEARIGRCLDSLKWADEVLVIDGGSTDKTPEICKSKGVTFITRPWSGFRDQRNECLKLASNDWILVVDSDEEVSPECAQKIRELLVQPDGPPERAYKIRRIEYFLGKEITAGIWSPSWQDRFFHRKGVQYINDVHEYPVFAKPPGRIAEPIHHDPSFNIERFLDKMNRYTTIEVRDRIAQGKRTNPFRILFAFPAMFLKNYFYYKAYKDGIRGFIISILEGVSRTVRHAKMWQSGRNNPSSPHKH